ncbi:MAG: TolB family protein, partial [Bryobacteraceae bacterium]
MRLFVTLSLILTGAGLLSAQQPPQITGVITHPGKPLIAVTAFRGAGAAAPLMDLFNQTVMSDLQGSPLVNFVPRTLYPTQVPQTSTDLIAGVKTANQAVNGLRLTDWSLPPTSAGYLGFGYGAEDHGMFVIFGWFYTADPHIPTLQQAQVFGRVYTASLDKAGAIDAGHRYAADILAVFGGKSLVGTRIVFVSNRSGHKEIWVMNWDGTNQKQLTHYGSISVF